MTFKAVELLFEFGELKAQGLELLPELATLLHQANNVLISPLREFKGASPTCFPAPRRPGVALCSEREKLAADGRRREEPLRGARLRMPWGERGGLGAEE